VPPGSAEHVHAPEVGSRDGASVVPEEDALALGGAGERVDAKLPDALLHLDTVGVSVLDSLVSALHADVLDLHVATRGDRDPVRHVAAVDEQPLDVHRAGGVAAADLDRRIVVVRRIASEVVDGDSAPDDDDIATALDPELLPERLGDREPVVACVVEEEPRIRIHHCHRDGIRECRRRPGERWRRGASAGSGRGDDARPHDERGQEPHRSRILAGRAHRLEAYFGVPLSVGPASSKAASHSGASGGVGGNTASWR
jgi:hypothetical protein